MPDHDPVNHPAHYTSGPIEVIEIIEGFGLGFCLGNVVKYVLRSRHKGAELIDLKKARWYLDREIARLGGQPADSARDSETPEDSDERLSPEWLEKALGSRMHRKGISYYGDSDSPLTIMGSEYGFYAKVDYCEIESCRQVVQLILATGFKREATQ